MHATKRSSGRRPVLWELASSAGLISVVIVILGTLVLALTARLDLGSRLSRLIPTLSALPDLCEKAQEVLEKAAPPQAPPRRRESKSFGLGDSAETALKVQGTPASRTGTTWHYGDSRVTVIAGRVTGWVNAPSNPLRIR